MISFGTWGKKVLHGFLSWHLWVNITLDDEIIEKYVVLIQKKIKSEKTIMFDDLYEEFLKFQISRFYGANSKTHYHYKDLVKKEFDEMIRAAMNRKYKVYIKKQYNKYGYGH